MTDRPAFRTVKDSVFKGVKSIDSERERVRNPYRHETPLSSQVKESWWCTFLDVRLSLLSSFELPFKNTWITSLF